MTSLPPLPTRVAAIGPTELTPIPDAPLATALGASLVEQATVHLPSSRRVVHIPAYVRTEVNWTDVLPREFSAIPNKRAYALDGVPLYPELLIVRLLERAGWGAAWRKTWGGDAYWRDINEKAEPSPLAMTIVEQVSRQAGYAGSWDIIAWRSRELRLLSSRRAGGQRVSAFMADWLDAALRMGIPLGCFALVEHHSVTRPPARRRF
jgi:hypothetical protein